MTHGRAVVWREVIRRLLGGIGIGPPASSRGNGSWCDCNSWHWHISSLEKGNASDYPGLMEKIGKKTPQKRILNSLISNYMFAFQSSNPRLVYRIPLACQLQLTGSGCLKQWSKKNAEATSGLSGKECHNWLVMSIRSCHTCVTPIIYDTVEEICLLRWMVWEDKQIWFWNRYIYLCKWTNRFSDDQSISVSFTWGCSFGWTEKMQGLNQQPWRY